MVFLEKILDLKLLNKMRLVGGFLKGKRINNPLDKLTRPLKDLVRESIFNIITHSRAEYIDLKNAKILDLFSGTGSFGLECISRGAEKITFVEIDKNAAEITKNRDKTVLDLIVSNSLVKITINKSFIKNIAETIKISSNNTSRFETISLKT